jgi:hypothetical protein
MRIPIAVQLGLLVLLTALLGIVVLAVTTVSEAQVSPAKGDRQAHSRTSGLPHMIS